MSDSDDPFGLANDAGRTRIRPVNRPRAETAPLPQAPAGGQAGAFAVQPGGYGPDGFGAPAAAAPGRRVRHQRATANPLVSAFSALLEFAPELESSAPPASPETLRARLLDNLIDARDGAVALGAPLSRADQAAWFVAALLDDLALNTPWGGHSDWPRQPLVVSLYGDVDAGTRFFDRLEELARYPDRDRDLLELGYLCVSLGFRGKFRVQGAAGSGALLQARTGLARVLRNPEAEAAPLSPNWQGVAAADEPRRFAAPLWSILLIAAALIAATYVGLGMRLSARGEQLFALAEVLPPPERAAVFRPPRETAAPPPVIELEPVFFELLPEFRTAAPPDTAPALSGREDVSLVTLSVQGAAPELFRSAKAEINEDYRPLIASVAAVIRENAEIIGGVTVIGHTDSVPVQSSNPFASNQGLSEARAATIARLLAEAGLPPEIAVRSEGRAATEPVGDNATKEGRARNRRIEIRIEKKV